jgi:glucose-1-phosphate cytidylyltransferase
MKVVIFCGGLGVRMGEATQTVPKPMVTIGGRPILWHLMKYYAAFGHTDFILCLGYRAEAVKEYFLQYRQEMTNDFVLLGGREAELLGRDIADWRVTFVDTGLSTTIGERLKAVQPYLAGESTFLATYGDGLTDAPLNAMLAEFYRRSKVAMLLSVKPSAVFHVVDADEAGIVHVVEEFGVTDQRINGGFFIFGREVLDLISPGEDLVGAPFQRLIAAKELIAYPYDGFWQAMDTLKDRQQLESLWESGEAPWRQPQTEVQPRDVSSRFPFSKMAGLPPRSC